MKDLHSTLFIFDIDGTLTDSVPMYLMAVTQAMLKLGIQDIDTDYNNYKHHPDSYALRYNYERNFLKQHPVDLLEQFEQEIVSQMELFNSSKEILGAKVLIELLRKSNVPFSFATGALPKPAMMKLEDCGIWYDEALLATSKTHESREGFVMDAIDRAKRYYKKDHFERIVSIGDGLWDMITAQNLKLDFVGIGEKHASHFKNIENIKYYPDITTFTKSLT